MQRDSLKRYAWLSIVTALVTIGLKGVAYFYTGSVGLFSDALESLINLAAAILTLWILKVAAQPPDDEHAFGHDKAEYFSSGIEGTLIFLAAVSIAYAVAQRWLSPHSLQNIGFGLAMSLPATLLNLVVGQILIRVGVRQHSIALEADGRHLMTDVWTSLGVIAGIVLIRFTGWLTLDPLIALLVAVNITWTGYKLVSRSVLGLMDTAVSSSAQQAIVSVLDEYVARSGIQYHALRTRQAGARKFVYVHILVPDEWSVKEGHDLLENLELDILRQVANTTVFTHLEPLTDPASWEDLGLSRPT